MGSDKVLPKVTHILNRGATLREHGVDASNINAVNGSQVAKMRASYAADQPAVMSLYADVHTLLRETLEKQHAIANERFLVIKPAPPILKEQIQQPLYDPHWRFIVEWQRLAAELGVCGEETNLYWPRQYVEISVPVSGKALAAAVSNEQYHDGLPPEHLRRVWSKWEAGHGTVYIFDGEFYRCDFWVASDKSAAITSVSDWCAYDFRPLGATWAEVEALAAAAAKP